MNVLKGVAAGLALAVIIIGLCVTADVVFAAPTDVKHQVTDLADSGYKETVPAIMLARTENSYNKLTGFINTGKIIYEFLGYQQNHNYVAVFAGVSKNVNQEVVVKSVVSEKDSVVVTAEIKKSKGEGNSPVAFINIPYPLGDEAKVTLSVTQTLELQKIP